VFLEIWNEVLSIPHLAVKPVFLLGNALEKIHTPNNMGGRVGEKSDINKDFHHLWLDFFYPSTKVHRST
jgi:hypothetical protein